MDIKNNVFKPLSAAQSHYNTRLKYFGEDFTQISCFSKPIFNPHGVEDRHKKAQDNALAIADALAKKVNEDEGKAVRDAVRRAQQKCFEIAYANDFTHFFTLTLDSAKISRTDTEEISKALKHWLKNNVQRRNFSYLITTEYHKRGKAIHFHGLCLGDMEFIDSGTVSVKGRAKPIKLSTATREGLEGKTVYNIANWRYGFSTAVELDGERGAWSRYITKYITKDSDKIFGRYYFSGGALKRSVPTEYRNEPYSEFDGKEVVIPSAFLAVKYKTI